MRLQGSWDIGSLLISEVDSQRGFAAASRYLADVRWPVPLEPYYERL